jgi:acetolactate decarboxylase
MGNDAHHPCHSLARSLLAHHFIGSRQKMSSEVYQSSTMGALLDGIYDGNVTIADLLTHGDFGLGTFNHLDGEMVILDHVCYHLRADGSARIADKKDLTPFAAVTWFKPHTTIRVSSPASRMDVIGMIDNAIESANLIHAIRVSGTFATMLTRTVSAQTKPYPPLTEATADEPRTVLHSVAGTLAGFRTPDFEEGISVAGDHLHFIDEARAHGGHMLDFELEKGELAIGSSSELHLSLPTTKAFLDAKLSAEDLAEQIRQSEGG